MRAGVLEALAIIEDRRRGMDAGLNDPMFLALLMSPPAQMVNRNVHRGVPRGVQVTVVRRSSTGMRGFSDLLTQEES
jgi:hypothetical protein